MKIIGKTIKCFTEKDKNNVFFNDDRFCGVYGVKEPIKVKLTVIDTFNDGMVFENSFEKDNDMVVYGIWEKEKNIIDVSFIFKHPLQTKVCSFDFFKYEIEKGSLFLKLKVEPL